VWIYDVQVEIQKDSPEYDYGNDSQTMRHITHEISNRRFDSGINGINEVIRNNYNNINNI